MVGFACANQVLFASDLNTDSNLASQSGGSDDEQTDGMVSLDCICLHKRLEVPAPALEEDKCLLVSVLSAESELAPAQFSARPISFLMPIGIFVSQAGLMPRAPSLS